MTLMQTTLELHRIEASLQIKKASFENQKVSSEEAEGFLQRVLGFYTRF